MAYNMGGMVKKMPFKDSVKVLATNKNFILVLLGFTFYYGPLQHYHLCSTFFFKPFNFTDIKIASPGACVIVTGLIGAID
jgi:hypothetical protein